MLPLLETVVRSLTWLNSALLLLELILNSAIDSTEGKRSREGPPLRTFCVEIPSIEPAARLGCGLVVAPFAAAMSFGGLKQVADLYQETCARNGQKPGRLICSYFTHFADDKAQEDAQRARQIRYYKECVIPALPGDPKTAPPSYRYFVDMVERLHKTRPEDLTEIETLIANIFSTTRFEMAAASRGGQSVPLQRADHNVADLVDQKVRTAKNQTVAPVEKNERRGRRRGRRY